MQAEPPFQWLWGEWPTPYLLTPLVDALPRHGSVMSESIQTMAVHNTSLYLGGDYVYNHYVDGKDADFYLAGDRIRHMAIVSVPERAGDGAASAKVFPVMACADRALRVMDGSNVLHHITTDDSPRCLCAFPGEEAAGEIVYGGSKGGLGCVALTTTTHEALWTIEGGGQAAVSCVDCHDVTDDGVAEILVGRDDGTVQVFRVASRHEPPTCVYSTRLLAAVTSIKGGRVFSADHGEVVCCTYSGQVLGLSTKVREGKAATSTDGAAAAAAMHDEESKALEAEVEALKFTLAREKTALERQSAARTEGAAAAAVLPDINVLDEFVLIAEQVGGLAAGVTSSVTSSALRSLACRFGDGTLQQCELCSPTRHGDGLSPPFRRRAGCCRSKRRAAWTQLL